MTALGFDTRNQTVIQMINDLDTDGSGEIEFPEFLKMMTTNPGDKDSKSEIEKIFNLFDLKKSGYITYADFMRVCGEIGEDISENDVQDIIDNSDIHSDQKVKERKINFE